jgi:type VI secretion system secreted protein VgrG
VENSVRALIKIDDEDIQYSSLSINQATGGHHTFVIRILYSQIASGMIQKKADAYLGKKFTLFLNAMEDQALLERSSEDDPFFIGVVNEVELLRDSPGKGYLAIRGASPTISLDSGPNTRSFTDKSLKEIADKVLADPGCKEPLTLEGELPSPRIEPNYGDTIPYVVQYKESNFQFLNRLALQYGEWFYFDNQKVVFGQHETPDEELTLYMAEDLLDFNLEVKVIPAQFKWQSYDYQKHEFPDSAPKLTAKGDLLKTAYKVSKDKIFPHIPLTPTGLSEDNDQLKFNAETHLKADSNRMVGLSGNSINPALKPGVIVNIVDRQLPEEEDYGTYIIVNVNHGISADGNYSNSFYGIPGDSLAPPPGGSASLPICEPQVAEVLDVNDEESLGRVRVQFPWQTIGEDNSEQTPWVRVSSPYTGGDKGFYVIPEVGDQVLVDFENSDPAKPYVVGGFYHGKAKPSFFDPENNQKAVIQTRAGNKILIDDKGGSEKITIANPSKNTITIDASGPSISISSSGGKIFLSSDEITLDAKNIKLNGSEKIEITAGQDLKMDGNNVKTTAQVSYEMKGTKVLVEGSATTDVKGAVLNVTATGIASVTGSMLKLNS